MGGRLEEPRAFPARRDAALPFGRRGRQDSEHDMPNITVRFFGPARDAAGTDRAALTLDDGATVGEAAAVLAEKYPQLGSSLGIRLAVNRAYVALDHVLAEADEVAVIPPVSGGSGVDRVRLTRDVIDVEALAADMQSNEAGAIITFVGTVRAERSDARTLAALDYHAYEDMAVEQLRAIRRHAGEKFEILDAAIVHRLGKLALGDASITIVVAAAHRAAAFDATRWIIDAVKADVPIWKKDVWADGETSWVDPTT